MLARDWKYESRRQMQAILPYLYLGPASAARDLEALQREGITMLLAIRDSRLAQAYMLSGEKTAHTLGLEAIALDVDGPEQLIAILPRAVHLINEHLVHVRQPQTLGMDHSYAQHTSTRNQRGNRPKILVFCETGNERSATVVTAYVLAMHDVDLVAAVQYVQARRYCIALDHSLKLLLRSFSDLLQATRLVESTRRDEALIGIGTFHNKAKRDRTSLEESGDLNVNAGEINDDERFVDRSNFAPFE